MTRLSEEAKQAIVEKALTRKSKLAEIASQYNIGYSTLHKWINKYKPIVTNITASSKSSTANQIARSQQLQHLLATAKLDEVELGVYCREHGLYSFQLQQWKNEFMATDQSQKKQEAQSELKALRAENKALKKDLLRKDRALAETAALLVLKKKADLLFGVQEDD